MLGAEACVNGARLQLEYESQRNASRVARRKEVRNVDLLGVRKVEEVDEDGRSAETDVISAGVLNDGIDLQSFNKVGKVFFQPCLTSTFSPLETRVSMSRRANPS